MRRWIAFILTGGALFFAGFILVTQLIEAVRLGGVTPPLTQELALPVVTALLGYLAIRRDKHDDHHKNQKRDKNRS